MPVDIGINRRSDVRPACETTRNSKVVTENIPYSIEDQPLNLDQRVWRWKVLTSTYFAYAGFYLVRKVFPLCKTTLADKYGIGFEGVANIWTRLRWTPIVGQRIGVNSGMDSAVGEALQRASSPTA